jgi:hypothetical protein
MMPQRALSKKLVLLAAAVWFTACANQMEPAKQALDAATNALTLAAHDGEKYEPARYEVLDGRLTELRNAFDLKNYATVLAEAPSVVTGANDLAQSAAADRDRAMTALNAQWTGLASSVPTFIASVKARVDALGKSKRRPKDVNLTAAKPASEDASVLWEKAGASFAAGDVERAVSTAREAQAKAVAAATALKLKVAEP